MYKKLDDGVYILHESLGVRKNLQLLCAKRVVKKLVSLADIQNPLGKQVSLLIVQTHQKHLPI